MPFAAFLIIAIHYSQKYISIYFQFKKNTIFIGNTCIDLTDQRLFLWNGEYKHITDTDKMLIKMLVEAAPVYKLSKDDVCRKIWNRNSKDGQALYNVAMTKLRGLFISDDSSLELKSLPREGMQLLINDAMISKKRWLHFVLIYLRCNSK